MKKGNHVDLVLVNPGNRAQVYQSLGASLAAIEPPVWAGLMATFVRKRGFSVQIVDANAEGLGPEETAQRIVELNPILTAVVVYGHQPSASTQVMPAASALCTALKEAAPHVRVILIGGHVAALPEQTLQQEHADFVAGGEGLWTLVELLEALRTPGSDLTGVRDLYMCDGDAIRKGPSAPLVLDLDRDMPGIAWDLLPMERYRAHNWHCFGHLQREPYAALYTSLGCPFHCTFCCIQAPFKSGERTLGYSTSANSYRLWSPDAVIAQIDTLVREYGVSNIKLADEIFVLKPGHVLRICDLIIERGYNLNIWAYARVDTLTDRMVDKLKQAGVNWLAFGIEAANEHVRKDVRKGYRHSQVGKVIDLLKAADIYVIGNYIFGLPEDSMETMQQTLDLALELNCEFANFYCNMAYPGSDQYDLARREGWPLPETWGGYSQHSYDTAPLPTRYLSAADVLAFRDHAFDVYFSGRRYLDMVQETFGPDTVQHIRDMASHKLARKLLERQ